MPPGSVGTASADGPWNQRVLLANSNDGLIWEVSGEVLAEQRYLSRHNPAILLDEKAADLIC